MRATTERVRRLVSAGVKNTGRHLLQGRHLPGYRTVLWGIAAVLLAHASIGCAPSASDRNAILSELKAYEASISDVRSANLGEAKITVVGQQAEARYVAVPRMSQFGVVPVQMNLRQVEGRWVIVSETILSPVWPNAREKTIPVRPTSQPATWSAADAADEKTVSPVALRFALRQQTGRDWVVRDSMIVGDDSFMIYCASNQSEQFNILKPLVSAQAWLGILWCRHGWTLVGPPDAWEEQPERIGKILAVLNKYWPSTDWKHPPRLEGN